MSAAGFLGVLMLDTRFPRPPGDVGNRETFERAGIPVHFVTVQGASPRKIVQEADPAFLQPFLDEAIALAAQGARLISTSCGFLAKYQALLQAAVPVPVVTSSLLQCRGLDRVGIVTFDAQSLTRGILDSVDVPADAVVEGLTPGCEMHARILENSTVMDLAQVERNVVEAARRLVQRAPGLRNIVLECTNMPPYRDAVAQATGLPVHDIETLILKRWRALPA
ncbi:aspartate/glutamate racemase family protein [Achromobacter deleyi]|uniref:aspartate/glutamate racemase family protein n=1 Tax=Achromobacter deleyi TaxID=1353891 RepID=UPI001491D3D8|nr:aspartate/glutamate racemase family protein [Achromobacter deleyi]QVQ27277.1 aspartate/glutamate racemase family protein [Achromobacter deleyi]UIP22869.1 aspartate/glutamate racemase family protein [Achromobacter deleyi]